MSFEHDIMISYAWRDNQPPPLSEGTDGWVSSFQLLLEHWLRQLSGRQPKVWRDKNQMPGNKVFAEELDEIVGKVAVLLTVVSEPYLTSEWCARELANFIKHAQDQGGLQVDNDYRIFKINKLPVDRKAIPEPLKPVTGFDFFETDPETRLITPIDPSFGKEETEEFRKKVYNVANSMSKLLKAMDARGIKPRGTAPATSAPAADGATTTPNSESAVVTPAEPAAPGEPAAGPVIFLPYTSRDLREVRDDLVAELQRRGCTVIPTSPPTWADVDDFKKMLAEDLERATIAIHLLGSRYGSIPEGETRSVAELQIEATAAQAVAKGMRRLIWVPKEMGDVNPQQAVYLAQLRGNREHLKGADLLEDTLENLKSSVLDLLKPKPAATPPVAEGIDDGFLLYLMHDAGDRDAVREVRKLLKGKQVGKKSLTVLLPVFEGDATELRELQRQKLMECDAVILFWGGSSEAWVDASLNEVRKAPGYGRKKKFAGKHLVILGGSKTSPKEDWLLDFEDGLLEADVDTRAAFEGLSDTLLSDHLKSLGD